GIVRFVVQTMCRHEGANGSVRLVTNVAMRVFVDIVDPHRVEEHALLLELMQDLKEVLDRRVVVSAVVRQKSDPPVGGLELTGAGDAYSREKRAVMPPVHYHLAIMEMPLCAHDVHRRIILLRG